MNAVSCRSACDPLAVRTICVLTLWYRDTKGCRKCVDTVIGEVINRCILLPDASVASKIPSLYFKANTDVVDIADKFFPAKK